jgi:hypothetical protein
MSRPRFVVIGIAAVLALSLACSRQNAAPTSPSSSGSSNAAGAAADGSTLKVTSPVPVSPVNDAQVNDLPTLTVTASTMKFTDPAPLQYRFEIFDEAGVKRQDSGLVNGPSFKVTATLSFRKRHTWRARAEREGAFGPWSTTGSFVSAEGGYIRGNEVFDPLYNGATVGELIGPTTFLPDKGIRLEANTSYVRYLIPQTITSGEFSMEVEGLRANASGDKSKVFGVQEGTGEYITNPYRVDIQYRGTAGFPPNAITFRALYGSAHDLDVRYEPPTAVRYASVYLLDPSTTYYWRWTWGTEVRLTVKAGGINGQTIYDYGKAAPNGTYSPSPHYAFIGVPAGRSGVESASIPGTIYRNVWIGARPRPE